MRGGGSRRRMRGVLYASFAAIAVIVALGNVTSRYDAYQARMAGHAGLINAFDSVALMAEIQRDLARERVLVDRHIALERPDDLARTAAQIDAVDRDLDRTAAAYRPLLLFPDESPVWARVEADVATLRGAVHGVLALSTQNRDREAHERLSVIDDTFARANGDLARLIDINRAGGIGTIDRVDAIEHGANLRSTVLAAMAIVLVVAVALFATRLVGRREREMLRYAERLEEQNRELDAFAGRVAHDLRGPLTAMSMAVARMIKNAPEGGSVGTVMQRSVQRMERLIRDLLSLSQVEAQSQGAVCDPASAAALVRDEHEHRPAPAHATLRVDVQPAKVRAAEGLLVEALSNLTENATKYARPGVAPEIDIRGRAREGVYELSVADNGMGMSPEEVQKVFLPFYRANRAPNTPGTGLGLSIVKRVAEVSGGSVSLESTLGRGSTFVLRLRLAEHARVG